MATQLIATARSKGLCNPSLLPDEGSISEEDVFFGSVIELLDDQQGLSIRNEAEAAIKFESIVKMATADDLIDTMNVEARRKVAVHRRSIILAIIGATPTISKSLGIILNGGFLSEVKIWLDDILNGVIGGVDLLLHLLSNICMLPVTKEMVTSSKLGKQVSAVEKHKICVGGMNEEAIKEKVGNVKEEWSASVKKMKLAGGSNGKRKAETLLPDKKIHAEEEKVSLPKKMKQDTLSSIIKKVSPVRIKEESHAQSISSDASLKKEKHIKWADAEDKQGIPQPIKDEHNLEDRKMRDRLREKELLQKARNSKLVENEDSLDTMVMMYSGWTEPKRLPLDPENPAFQVNSKEVAVQLRRMTSVLQANYSSEEFIPNNPAPLSDIEQALDMTSHSTFVPELIPFFVPQQDAAPAPVAPAPIPIPVPVPVPVPLPVQAPITALSALPPTIGLSRPSNPQPVLPVPPVNPSVATAEVVQAMGLPLFLAGQNIRALQTLAASPGLLNAFLDAHGGYDQIRIMNLVQTLTQNLPAVPQPVVPAPAPINTNYQPPPITPQYITPQAPQYQAPPQASTYGPSQGLQPPSQGLQPPSQGLQPGSRGYRGDQNVSDGNLHISGYGPMTTPDSIIALFAPYVKVDEVVPKNGFMFVNTNNPDGARRAREALNGVMLGGSPLRINVALRRNKNPTPNDSVMGVAKPRPNPIEVAPLPRDTMGNIDYNSVRDDRGNPGTKNLFVAGYGQGTTEQELKDIFGQHTKVNGVVMKGSFSFVNTGDKTSAIHSRDALTGAVVNGGVLRINFAKESGRLGTSFDQGYTAPLNEQQPQNQRNYYGRGY